MQKTTDLPTDSVEMVRAIRDRCYEETKNMSPEERMAYRRKKLEEFEEIRKQINPADYDFSFLASKK
ncbi:MAG: hypothetical protein LBQ50_05015 [Planctomycetaceae bacterium]|jgi:hypothetical protein|nr:hypothetical protein [Planctomycetaceae bacterium]